MKVLAFFNFDDPAIVLKIYKKKPRIAAGLKISGSSTWARTRDTWINSPLLYQLSYRGIGEGVILKTCRL